MVESPHNCREEKNIFGEIGCKTPDGCLCTACCTLYAVDIINKPQWTECVHQTKNGCNIYKDCNRRPQACQRYHCSQIIRALEGTRDPNSRKRLEELIYNLVQIAYENGETSLNPQV